MESEELTAAIEAEHNRRLLDQYAAVFLGKRLPAPDLDQDPAFAAFLLGTLEKRVAVLEAALAPFVAEASRRSWVTNLSPASGLDEMNVGGTRLTNGDLRRARAALTLRVPS